jgi:Tfp pilus assembly PilM family ATPase
MFKLPFLHKDKSAGKFLAITIDADSVRVLPFYFDGTTAKIIGSAKEKLEPGSVRAGSIIDFKEVEDVVASAIMKATSELETEIYDAVVGIEGDLCLGITTTVRVKRPNASQLGQKEFNEINKKIVESAFMQAQNEYLEITGNSDIDLEIVTTSNVYTKTEGALIETAVYHAFVPSYHIKNLQKTLKSVGLSVLSISPTAYAIVRSLKYSPLEHNDFTLIEIGNDTTTVAIVFGGGIVATKTLDIGYLHFVEGISEKMGLTPLESAKVLRTYCSGQFTETEGNVVQKCIFEILSIWLEGLEILFGEFTGVKTFASKIYITGKGATLPDVITAVRERPWTKTIPFKENPEIRKIEFTDLVKISDSTGKINTPGWVPTSALSAIYLEMQRKND